MIKPFLRCFLYGFLTLSTVASASTFNERPDVQAYIKQTSKQEDFNPAVLSQYLSTVQIQPAIIASISKPYEKKPWDVYQAIFLKEKRIHNGVKFFKQHQAVLEQAEKTYGVPAAVIVAILGVETYYGEQQGSYRVLDALSTLAFDYPSRAPFFRKELTEFFVLCRQLNLNPTTVQGSYAGAIGQAQFMPSSYRHYAVDYAAESPGENHSDLRGNPDDAIVSIANYLQKNGWKADEPVTTPARIEGNDYRHIDTDAKAPTYTIEQFKAWGVTPLYVPPTLPNAVGLIRLDTSKKVPEYWIGFNNFYAITHYNTSKQYAMAVFFLAAQIQREMGI